MTVKEEGARRKPKRGWIGPALALAFGLGIGALHLASNQILEFVEERITLDWRFKLRGEQKPPNDIAIVLIDDRSLATLGQWPFSRKTLAQVVNRLTDAGAKTIGFDILLSEHEPDANAKGDLALAEALKRHGRAVLATAMLFNDGSPAGGPARDASKISLTAFTSIDTGAVQLIHADGMLRPLEAFEAVATVGHVNQQPDDAGRARTQYPVIAYGDSFIPSFSLMVAATQNDLRRGSVGFDFAGKLIIGPKQIPLDQNFGLALNYLGPTGTFRTYSFLDLYENRIPPELLKGRAILVGAIATSLGDTFATPYAANLPGVEVLATGVSNLLHGDSLIRTTEQRFFEAILIVFLALLGWYLGLRSPGPRWGAAFNFLLLVSWLALCHALFVFQYRWVAMTGPSLAIVGGSTLR